jgi:hypothetical protein
VSHVRRQHADTVHHAWLPPCTPPDLCTATAAYAPCRTACAETHDAPWLAAVGRALGGTARVVARSPLAGGYVSAAVERVDLDVDGRAAAVVLKRASPVELAEMTETAAKALDRLGPAVRG